MDSYTTSMRSGRTAVTAALLGLTLFLPGCGGDETATAGEEKGASTAIAEGRSAAGESNPASAAASGVNAKASPPAKRCTRTLGEFLDSMESLGNTLAVGLAYGQYLDTVDRVRATYAGVEAEHLGLVCLGRVGTPAERALNVYIEAANEWGDCLATPSCDTEAVEPRLQREWERASNLLAEARTGLRTLG
jgi:hypothetical protein